MRTLVAIPVFNEFAYVADVISRVRAYTPHILVVDDGSTDGSGRILDRTPGIELIRHDRNRGYGRSLIDAFAHAEAAGYDWVITLDCDDQHEPARLPDFLSRIAADDADIISGSRYLAEFDDNTPAPADRRTINRRITRLLNRSLGLNLTDAFCGFKAHRVAALSRMTLTVDGYAFPLQFWVQAAHHQHRFCELPVARIYHDPSRHFGGALDDAHSRYAHYLEVFRAELARVRRCDRIHSMPCTLGEYEWA